MASMRTEVFLATVAMLGFEVCIPNMKAKGYTTYATFPFATSYTPAQADADNSAQQLLLPMADKNEAPVPLLRATADIKRVVEGTKGDAPRKLTPSEMDARRYGTDSRLAALRITPGLEVGETFLEECVAMYERNKLSNISWGLCTIQMMDIAGKKLKIMHLPHPSCKVTRRCEGVVWRWTWGT